MAGDRRKRLAIEAPPQSPAAPGEATDTRRTQAADPPAADEFAAPSESKSSPSSPIQDKGQSWARMDVLLLIGILIFAGLLRFPRLSQPDRIVFDETYYAKDACLYVGHSQQFCDLEQETEQSYVHPPLGKWLIALGIKAFGYNSFGWRISAALFGTGLAGLAFVFARQLLRDRWAAGAAGVLVATDFLLIAQSRIAMLDIFLAFFVLLGFVCLAFERHLLLHSTDSSGGRSAGALCAGHIIKWRLAATLCLSLGMTVKWSAIWALAAAAAITFSWPVVHVIQKRKDSRATDRSARKILPRELLVWSISWLLLPPLVYLAVYSPYLIGRNREECAYTVPASNQDSAFGEGFLGFQAGQCIEGSAGALLSFADLQQRIFEYHRTLEATHSYQSKAWTWPLVLRPVAYHFEASSGRSAHILAFGNIATWYAALGAAVWLLIGMFKRKKAERLVLIGWGAQYLPWLLVSRPLFFFYMTPVVPFMMIALAAALSSLKNRSKATRRFVYGYLALGVGLMLIYFYPVITGISLPDNLWQSRMWLDEFRCGPIRCGWI